MTGAADYANALDRAMTAIYAGKDIQRTLNDTAKEWDTHHEQAGRRRSSEPSYAAFLKLPRRDQEEHGREEGPGSQDLRPDAGSVATARRQTTRRRSRAASSWVDRNIRWIAGRAVDRLVILALTIFPLGFAIWASFVQYDFSLGLEHPWVGLDNYKDELGATRCGSTRSG